jgi:hypothetical protein
MLTTQATYVLTIGPIVNVVLVLGVFPLVNWLVAKRNPTANIIHRDLWVSKIISVAAWMGCFLVAFSFTLPEFIFCESPLEPS